MTNAELIETRNALREAILDLLSDFESITGMPVQRIEYEIHEVNAIGPTTYTRELKILL